MVKEIEMGIEKTNEAETLDAIRRALSGLRYGSIEVVVHDSKVVQIERKEKVRLQTSAEGLSRNGAAR